jgi:sterol desaturase/sphingolipid hydroxylase (fatty acid hydroxylase superfamily)
MRFALYTSYFNYGFEALCVNEFAGKNYSAKVLDDLVSAWLDALFVFAILPRGCRAFSPGSLQDMVGANEWIDIYVLFAMFVALRFVTYLMLRHLHREKR